MSNVIPAPQRLIASDGTIYIIDYCLDHFTNDVSIRHIAEFKPNVQSGRYVKITDVPDYLRLMHWQSFHGH